MSGRYNKDKTGDGFFIPERESKKIIHGLKSFMEIADLLSL